MPVLVVEVEAPHCNCLSGGQVMLGPVVSTKLICWMQVALLLQPSMAFQVRAMPGLPAQLAGVGASLNVIVTEPPQLSVAVAEPVLAGAVEAPHCSCLSGGQAMTGALVSTKMICWTQVELLLQPSVAFQVRAIPGLPVQLAG